MNDAIKIWDSIEWEEEVKAAIRGNDGRVPREVTRETAVSIVRSTARITQGVKFDMSMEGYERLVFQVRTHLDSLLRKHEMLPPR